METWVALLLIERFVLMVKGRRGGTKFGGLAALVSSLLFCGGNEGDGRSWQLWLKLEGTGNKNKSKGSVAIPRGEKRSKGTLCQVGGPIL